MNDLINEIIKWAEVEWKYDPTVEVGTGRGSDSTKVAEEMTVDFSSGKCSEGRFERSIGPSEADSNKRTDSWSGTDSISSANKSSFRARSIFE